MRVTAPNLAALSRGGRHSIKDTRAFSRAPPLRPSVCLCVCVCPGPAGGGPGEAAPGEQPPGLERRGRRAVHPEHRLRPAGPHLPGPGDRRTGPAAAHAAHGAGVPGPEAGPGHQAVPSHRAGQAGLLPAVRQLSAPAPGRAGGPELHVPSPPGSEAQSRLPSPATSQSGCQIGCSCSAFVDFHSAALPGDSGRRCRRQSWAMRGARRGAPGNCPGAPVPLQRGELGWRETELGAGLAWRNRTFPQRDGL
nr:PREDICTED: collagen alpha-1(I) chain [Lepisosteus oculatus]